MPAATALKGAASAAARIEDLASAGLPAQQLIEGVADQIGRVVPNDSLFFSATDPDTSLMLGAGVVRGMPDAVCGPFWEFEFEVPDFNKFNAIARGPQHAVDLHAATGGRPERSPRWRELKSIMDADGELRACFNAGDRTWGLLHLNRCSAHASFGDDEVRFVEAIAPVVGRGLRRSLITFPADGTIGRGPGMAILDERSRLVSVTAEAVEWLAEIATDSSYTVTDPAMDIRLPGEIFVAAQEARGRRSADGSPPAAVRTRLRTRGGAWMLVHASCLREADGSLGHTALVIEPAKASEIAPLIAAAYELTPRELDVTRALARGLSTHEIALELHLSRYTIQDHLKSVYEKTGVSSRGELVAKLYADHHEERLHEALGRARPA